MEWNGIGLDVRSCLYPAFCCRWSLSTFFTLPNRSRGIQFVLERVCV